MDDGVKPLLVTLKSRKNQIGSQKYFIMKVLTESCDIFKVSQL